MTSSLLCLCDMVKLSLELKKNCWATCEKSHWMSTCCCLPACLRLKIEKETNGLGTCWHDVVDYELFQFSLSDFISTSFKEFFLRERVSFLCPSSEGEKTDKKDCHCPVAPRDSACDLHQLHHHINNRRLNGVRVKVADILSKKTLQTNNINQLISISP